MEKERRRVKTTLGAIIGVANGEPTPKEKGKDKHDKGKGGTWQHPWRSNNCQDRDNKWKSQDRSQDNWQRSRWHEATPKGKGKVKDEGKEKERVEIKCGEKTKMLDS